jgi:ADP-ribose pyrophosphatase
MTNNCKNCGSNLLGNQSVIRVYNDKSKDDDSNDILVKGHFDAGTGYFEADTSISSVTGRHDLSDNSDTCAFCGSLAFGSVGIDIKNKETVFNGHFSVNRYTIKEGDTEYVRDICESRDAVFVLPYDPVNKKVVLIKEKRFGLLPHTDSIETWSSIAGTVDKDISLEGIVAMELEEEAGIDIASGVLHKICTHYSSPGIMSEQKHIYFFEFDSTTFKDGTFGAVEENETTHATLVSYDVANEMAHNGLVTDLNVMFALAKLT